VFAIKVKDAAAKSMSQINTNATSNKNGLCNELPGLGVVSARTSSETVQRLGIFPGVSTSNSDTVRFRR
jgi:hypothetical protein